MSATEQLWFAIGISGFVILLEGAITYMGQRIRPSANQNIIKTVSGVIIFALAVVMLFQVARG